MLSIMISVLLNSVEGYESDHNMAQVEEKEEDDVIELNGANANGWRD